MSKHTPGPWTLETVRTQSGQCHKIGPFPARRGGDGERHACLYADYPSAHNPADIELLANARLISAAPELLAALERLITERKLGLASVGAWETARSVIAKARGEQ